MKPLPPPPPFEVTSRWVEDGPDADDGYVVVSFDGEPQTDRLMPMDMTTGNRASMRVNLDNLLREAYARGRADGYAEAQSVVVNFLGWATSPCQTSPTDAT